MLYESLTYVYQPLLSSTHEKVTSENVQYFLVNMHLLLVYTAKYNFDDSDEEGTRHFMVNVIEPQFNLHSEEANVSSETNNIYDRYLKLFLGNNTKCK